MPMTRCGADMRRLSQMSNEDIQVIEDTLSERLALGVSQVDAERQALNEAIAQLQAERKTILDAVAQQYPALTAAPVTPTAEKTVEQAAPAALVEPTPVRYRTTKSEAAAAAAGPVQPLNNTLESIGRRYGGKSGAMVAADVSHSVKKLVYSLASLHDLVDEFKTTVPAIGKWYNALQKSIATRRSLELGAEDIAAAVEKLKDGSGKLNDFLSRSTYEKKWGYDPKIKGRTVVVDEQMAEAFNALSKQEQDIARAVFDHGEQMYAKKVEVLTSLGVTDMFTDAGRNSGPYSPLKRFGNYLSVLKSADLLAAEKAEDTKAIEGFKRDGNHYVVSSFDTLGQAKQFAYANSSANGGSFASADAFEKSERVGEQRAMNADLLQRVMAAVKMNPDVPVGARDAVNQMVQDMYFQSLDEQNARTSGLRRLNRAGYDTDMVRSFLSHARAEAGFLANMEHGGDINSEFLRMQEQAKDPNTGQRIHQDAVNTIAAHYASTLNYRETPWQDRAMALTSAWQLATSVGYHVTNAMQGIMVTIPKLGADFDNYGGAWRHLLNGYKTLSKTGIWGNVDLSQIENPGLRAALEKAVNMGVLDVGMDEDLTRFEATRTGLGIVDNTGALARTALHKLRQVSRAVETANRISSAVAGYNMSKEAGHSTEQAQEYAVRILQSTQGDFSRVGSPLLLKSLPKVMTQYKKYQFMMAALYAKAFRDAFTGATPETRAIGKRMLAYKLFHTGMAAGALGMPLMNLVSAVWAALGGDDEPEDLERTLREQLGDENLAALLLHGPLAMMGLDMSAKLGDDKIFSIMPYGSWDFSSASATAKTMFSLAGPAASQAGRFADGAGAFMHGDYYKGTEKFVPKGLESAMKAFRIANEGYTLKNGDVLFKPEDINGLALALDAIGMPSSELKKMDWLRSKQYEIGEFYQRRTKEVEHDYYAAYKGNDGDAMEAARAEWAGLQDGKDHMRGYFGNSNDALKRQPLSVLMRYPQTAAKREQKLQRGTAGMLSD